MQIISRIKDNNHFYIKITLLREETIIINHIMIEKENRIKIVKEIMTEIVIKNIIALMIIMIVIGIYRKINSVVTKTIIINIIKIHIVNSNNPNIPK